MSNHTLDSVAAASGQFTLGGDLTVNRLGFGAMRITGKGIWGEPENATEVHNVLRRTLDLGINFIDTADSYGPEISERLIAETLHPYPDGLVIATKGGLTRQGPDQWAPVGRPEYLRQCVELSLRRLRLDRIDLYQLHRIDPQVPAEDQLGELKNLQDEGKIRHVGLSEVTVKQLEHAQDILTIISVQNMYNLANRKAEDVIDYCTAHGLAFIPWFPIDAGRLAGEGALADIASHHNASIAQIALAWLLRRSPVVLPIPGTSTVAHLEENTAAAEIQLSDEEFKALTELA